MRRYIIFDMLAWFALFQLFVVFPYGATDDVCSGPFSQFLRCIFVQVDNKFQVYQQESSPQVQGSIRTCFSSASCASPDFNNANVDYFLPEPWAGRVKKLLNLLENMDPRVERCMIDYFKAQASKKVASCVQQYGSADIQDFQMPAWPSTKTLDVSKLKRMTLNRMVVWNSTLQCGKSTRDDGALQRTLDCVRRARDAGQSESLCQARDKCRSDNIGSNAVCSRRMDSVQKALCACARAELGKYNATGGGGFVSSWRQLKDSVFQGQMEQQFKQCHVSNNINYPEDKVTEVKQAMKDAFADIIKQGSIPLQLMDALNTVASSMRDIIDEWRRAFCSSCRLESGDSELKAVRAALARQEQSSNGAANNQASSLGDQLRQALGG